MLFIHGSLTRTTALFTHFFMNILAVVQLISAQPLLQNLRISTHGNGRFLLNNVCLSSFSEFSPVQHSTCPVRASPLVVGNLVLRPPTTVLCLDIALTGVTLSLAVETLCVNRSSGCLYQTYSDLPHWTPQEPLFRDGAPSDLLPGHTSTNLVASIEGSNISAVFLSGVPGETS